MGSVSSAKANSNVSVAESKAFDAASGKLVSSTAFNAGPTTYTSSSTVPVTHHCADDATFSGSGAQTDTIDLTSFNDFEGVAKDATGKRMAVVRVIADSANSGVVTVGQGASNGYPLFGSGNDLEIQPGGEVLLKMTAADKMPAVAAGVKNIDISGTGGDSYKYQFLLG